MEPPSWQPKEVQTSTSQGSGSDPPIEGKSSTPSTPTAPPASAVSTPTSKDGDTVATDSMHDSSSFPRPSVPSVSSSSGPSFSYNIPQPDMAFSGGHSFQSRMAVTSPQSEVPKNVPVSATSLQPPASGQVAHPSTFLRGMSTQMMPPPSPVAVPRETSSNAANFSYNGHHQLLQKDQSGPNVSSAPSVSPVPHHTNQNFASPTFWMSSAPPFQPPPGAPRIPVTSTATPGRAPPPSSPNTTVQTNPSSHQPIYATYPSNNPHIPAPQGVWLQPAPIGGLSRPQLLPYPPAFPGSFSLPAQRMPPPDAQPPGTSIGSMPSVGSGMSNELPPGTGIKEESVGVEQLDAWSAHRTETGILYYYNAVTGQSTYHKPAGFKGEPEKVYAQPTPISWEKCAGTYWSLVTTNDGKRYYYNAKTKLSSWKIPTDVTELRKRQESEMLKEESMSVQNATTLTEKGSLPLSLSAPTITTGGRDAISVLQIQRMWIVDQQKRNVPANLRRCLRSVEWPHSRNGKRSFQICV